MVRQLRSQTVQEQRVSRERRAEINRQLSLLIQHQDQLVNMRLNEEINPDTYAAKATELRDREASLKLQLDACDLGRHENGEIAVKTFELLQNLRAKWLTADYPLKGRYLEIHFLNFVLDDVTLVPTTRKEAERCWDEARDSMYRPRPAAKSAQTVTTALPLGFIVEVLGRKWAWWAAT